MKGIKFTLSGETAFFKKPDVNTYLYFTYSQIHKVALLGLLGSIIGLEGYASQKDKEYPMFYEVLKDLKVAIIPTSNSEDIPGLCSKKVQVFNNSVGYASKEEGGNLIVKEQWLEKPSWEIYLLEDSSKYYTKLKEYLLNRKCVYMPYLGKNDHFANISEVQEVTLDEVEGISNIHSLYIKSQIQLEEVDYGWEEEEEFYKYEEKLPIGLEKQQNQYLLETFVFTNKSVGKVESKAIYKDNNKNLYFF